MIELHVSSTRREELLPITRQLQEAVHEQRWQNGCLLVYCPHTTGALTVNESADPDVSKDMRAFMSRLVPRDDGFSHAEGNSDAHIKTSLFGPHVMLIVNAGRVLLGTWQGVYFCEWDGPRKRTIWLQFLPGA